MDPYLEHPDVFPDLHAGLIFALKEALQPSLPEQYFAQSDERVWLEISGRHVGPDVSVLERQRKVDRQDSTSAALAVAPPPRTRPVVVAVPLEERRELFLEIFAREDHGNRLVTAIEILSPTNKTPGLERREEYLKKQRELVHGKVHLVEIDLLRSGEHSTAVPRDRAMRVAGAFDYHVCIHRFDRLGDFLVYPILLEEPLPEVEIPLLPQDGAVKIDLQAVFNHAYDAGPYRKRVRYAEEGPVPPLSLRQQEWASRVLGVAKEAR